jgi:hypothetical protein
MEVSATGRGSVGAGVRAPGPYLLGSFSEAKNQNLVAGQSAPAVCNSAWSGERTPAPADPCPLRAKVSRGDYAE